MTVSSTTITHTFSEEELIQAAEEAIQLDIGSLSIQDKMFDSENAAVSIDNGIISVTLEIVEFE